MIPILGNEIVSRLTCSIGYSAYEWIRMLALPAGLFPLFACGAIFFRDIEGVHIMCCILAAQGLTALLPIPAEPGGYLVIPTVLMYFAAFSIVKTQMIRISDVADQFMSMSVNVRAIAYFKTTEQMTMASAMSLVFIILSPFKNSVIECFAVRATALWAVSLFQAETLLLACLLVNQYQRYDRMVSAVIGLVELKCAQQIIAQNNNTSTLAFVIIVLFFNKNMGGVATCGISILMTKRLESWIQDWGTVETACVYAGVFCLLHRLAVVTRHDQNTIVIVAHDDQKLF